MFELVMIIQLKNLRHFLLFCFTSCTFSNIVFSLNFSECVTENTSNFQRTTTGQFSSLFLLHFFCIWALFLRTNCRLCSFRFQTLLTSKSRGMKLNRKMPKNLTENTQEPKNRTEKSWFLGIHDCFMIFVVEIWYVSELWALWAVLKSNK